MKAIRTGTPATLESLHLVEADEPGQPGAGEILVRIRASSLNYHDYAAVSGMIPVAQGRIPMSDGAGEVVAIGENVREFAVGDHVVSTFFPNWIDGHCPSDGFRFVPGDGMDGYACELARMPATAFTHVPRGYSHAEAATLTCAGLTAWRALVSDGPLIAGQTVLVQGSGGVSIFALQIAKAMGARVIATSSSDEKLERMRAMGADVTINYKSQPDWGKAVAKASGGGVDHVVEIGGAGTLGQSSIATRPGGHIALIGVLAGFSGDFPSAVLMQKQIRLQGLTVGSRRQQQDFIRAIDANGIRPVIDSHYPLADLADAFRHQIAGAHFGKIVVYI